jgi:LysM repeat protein
MFFRKKNYMQMSANQICTEYLKRIDQKPSTLKGGLIKKTLDIGKKYLRNTCIALAGIAIFSSCAGINQKYDNISLYNSHSIEQRLEDKAEEDRFDFSFGISENIELSKIEESTEVSIEKPTEIFIEEPIKESTEEYDLKNINSEKKPPEIKYTVQKGDFLSKIGKKFNVDYKRIASYNNIQNPNLISVGQELIIPLKVSDKDVKEAIGQKDIGVKFTGEEIFRKDDSKAKPMTLEEMLIPVSEPYNHNNESEYLQRLAKVLDNNHKYSYLKPFSREIAAGAYAESRFRDIEVNDKRENSTGYHQIPNYKDKNYDFHCKIFGSKYDPKDKDTSILVYLSLVEYYASWVQGVSTTWNPLTAEEKAKVRENMTEEHVRLAIIGHNLPAKLRPKSLEKTKKGWNNPVLLGNRFTTGLTVSAKRYLDYVKKSDYN